jgi:hypothetical protein
MPTESGKPRTTICLLFIAIPGLTGSFRLLAKGRQTMNCVREARLPRGRCSRYT